MARANCLNGSYKHTSAQLEIWRISERAARLYSMREQSGRCSGRGAEGASPHTSRPRAALYAGLIDRARPRRGPRHRNSTMAWRSPLYAVPQLYNARFPQSYIQTTIVSYLIIQ